MANTVDYRVASRDDETDILAVLEEVAPEMPVLLDTPERQDAIRNIIVECHKSGKSWVAVDENSRVVGFVLQEETFMKEELSLCVILE